MLTVVRAIDTRLSAGSIRNAQAAVEENLRQRDLKMLAGSTVAEPASEDSSRDAVPFIAG